MIVRVGMFDPAGVMQDHVIDAHHIECGVVVLDQSRLFQIIPYASGGTDDIEKPGIGSGDFRELHEFPRNPQALEINHQNVLTVKTWSHGILTISTLPK